MHLHALLAVGDGEGQPLSHEVSANKGPPALCSYARCGPGRPKLAGAGRRHLFLVSLHRGVDARDNSGLLSEHMQLPLLGGDEVRIPLDLRLQRAERTSASPPTDWAERRQPTNPAGPEAPPSCSASVPAAVASQALHALPRDDRPSAPQYRHRASGSEAFPRCSGAPCRRRPGTSTGAGFSYAVAMNEAYQRFVRGR